MMRTLRLAAPWFAAVWLVLLGAPALASQATLVTPGPPLPMTTLASFLNGALQSVGSCNAGTTAPSNGTGNAAFAGECWINTSGNPWVFSYTPDGTNWVRFGALNTSSLTWLPYVSSGAGSFGLSFTNTETLTANRVLTIRLNDGSRNLTLGGDFATSAAFTLAGAFPATVTVTAATNATLPAGTHTLAGLDVSQTWSGTNNFTGPFQIGGTTETFPASGSLAGTSDSQALTNKTVNGLTITPASATLTIAGGKTLTDTSGAGANLLLGATGGGFTAYAGGSCSNQVVTAIAAAGGLTCATLTNSFLASGTFANITGTGTLTSGATGAGFTLNLAASTISGTLGLANGGTGQATAVAARQGSGLNVYGDEGTGHGDVSTTLGNSERMAYTTAALTAARTWTLPAANVTGRPYTLKVTDMANGVTATNTLTILRAGSDVVNGSGTSVAITAAGGGYECSSDGSSKWSCLAMGAASGGGVSSVTCGAGLSGGTITTSGTCTVDSTAWTAFTPSLSCGTAAFTTTSARTKALGKTVHMELDFTISTLGTCNNAITVTLPATAQSGAALVGREVVSVGTGMVCSIQASATTSNCTKMDASGFAAGLHYVVSGVYESQ